MLTRTNKFRIHVIKPRSAHLAGCINNGRVQRLASHLLDHRRFYIFNVHCWTNGHIADQAQARTCDMFQTIFAEVEYSEGTPYIIAGDLDADIADLLVVDSAIHAGQLIDVGAIALEVTTGASAPVLVGERIPRRIPPGAELGAVGTELLADSTGTHATAPSEQ